MRPSTPPTDHSDDACRDCQFIERRDFLRGVTLLFATIAAGLGATPATAMALPVTFGGARRRVGDEHSYPIPPQDGATIDHDAEIIVVRFQEKLYGFNLSCPHQHTALKWQAEDNQFQCPRHHSKYTPDGIFVSGRATRGLDRFGSRRDGDNFVVDVSKYYRQDENAAEWAAAFVQL